jgi:hypothetical protein
MKIMHSMTAQRSFKQGINLKNCQSHPDAHDKAVEGKMGSFPALRVLIACQWVVNLLPL